MFIVHGLLQYWGPSLHSIALAYWYGQFYVIYHVVELDILAYSSDLVSYFPKKGVEGSKGKVVPF